MCKHNRHNNENQKTKFCNNFAGRDGKTCKYFDGDGVDTFDTECNFPWASHCKDGNIYNCYKLKMQWAASITDEELKKYFVLIDKNVK